MRLRRSAAMTKRAGLERHRNLRGESWRFGHSQRHAAWSLAHDHQINIRGWLKNMGSTQCRDISISSGLSTE